MRRRLRGISVVFVLAAALAIPTLALLLPAPASAVAYTLYGSTSNGWGLTPGTITSPGPMLTVVQGERVDLSLFSADSAPHTWCIDYSVPADNICDANESLSFSSPTVPLLWSLFPSTPGTFTYFCSIHGNFVMRGTIVILPQENPSASISEPSGSSLWTGGSTHRISWNMSDFQDPNPSLTVYLNYTSSAGNGAIAGPLMGTANPNAFDWLVPSIDAGDVAVELTVIDRDGNSAVATSPVPTVDSTPPAVITRVPDNGATGVSTGTNLVITFSERMSRAETGSMSTVGLQDVGTLAWIPGTFSWNAGSDVLTFDPTPTLSPSTSYRVQVNTSAEDASDPGNPMTAPASWVFTTGAVTDTILPVITDLQANPGLTEMGQPTNLSAIVTDAGGVAEVWANVTLPDFNTVNLSLNPGPRWSREQVFAILGNYAFYVWATDTSGNGNRSADFGSFRVVDTTDPVLSDPRADPASQTIGLQVNLSVVAVDNNRVQMGSVNAPGLVNASLSFDAAQGRWFAVVTPTSAGSHTVRFWLRDPSDNWGSVTVSFAVTDPPPGPPVFVEATYVASGAVSITWSPPSDTDVQGYHVYRSTSSTGPFTQRLTTLPTPSTSLVDPDLRPDTTYYYVVRTVDNAGQESVDSEVVGASVPPEEALSPAILGGLIAAIVVALLVVVWLVTRKRRKTEPPR